MLLEASGDMGCTVACVGGDRGGGDLLVYVGKYKLFDLLKKSFLFGEAGCVCIVGKKCFEQYGEPALCLCMAEAVSADLSYDLHECRSIVSLNNDSLLHGQQSPGIKELLLDAQRPRRIKMEIVVGQRSVGEVASQMYLIRVEKSDLSGMQHYLCIRMIGDTDRSRTDHAEAEGRMGVFGKMPKGFKILLEVCIDNPLSIL